jgi:shikimate kinase
MPGVGKSYWAEQIAAHYGLQCIDLDDLIQVRCGMSIATFFERFGEEEFRKLERLTLAQVQEVFSSNCVIACGGGTPCYYDNLAKMRLKGKVVYLKGSLDYIYDRLNKENHLRPLLKKDDWEEKLAKMLEIRSLFFQQADFEIEVSNLSVVDFDRIVEYRS